MKLEYGLHNRCAALIALMAAVHIVLCVVFLHYWWSMVGLMILCTRPAMRPDKLLVSVWAAELLIAVAASAGTFTGHGTTIAFIVSSLAVVVFCGFRILGKQHIAPSR